MHIVNKKIAEMLIVCLPCHFGYGKAPVPCARGTPLAVLNDMQILTMTRTYLGPKLSMYEGVALIFKGHEIANLYFVKHILHLCAL